MIVEIDVKILKDNKITANQYLICYLIFKEMYELLNSYLESHYFTSFERDIDRLLSLSLLDRFDYTNLLDIKGYKLTPNCIKLVTSLSKDYFDDFLVEYPDKVVRPKGDIDYLKSDITRSRSKYNKLTKGKLHLHEHILQCLRTEISIRSNNGNMCYFKKLPNWLESEEWKAYESALEDAKKETQQERYGSKLE